MQDSLCSTIDNKTSLQSANLTQNGLTSLIACPIFQKELESVLSNLNLTPDISYMHYTIHSNALKMEEQLQDGIESASKKGNDVRFLVGRHCKSKSPIKDVVDGCGGKIPQGRNCIDMLIGSKLANELQKNRTSLITPAWIKMINQSIADGHWTVTDARVDFGWYDKIIILDTGVEPLDDEQIMEFYDLTQVEIEILPVTLEHFQGLLQDLLK
ncbi:MAG: DUF1638 domain-containing protein [Desulfocapsa sp.]|nr:DUF1638 domain-containing protein [Desulfocapsa sp.]